MAGETVVHPDTVAAVIAHLDAQLPAEVIVRKDVPNPRPDRLVTVKRSGGPQATRVSDRPQLTIDVRDVADDAVHDLAMTVRALVGGMATGANRAGVIVYRVDEFGGPVDLPDPDDTRPRYRWIVSVHARRAPGA
jgi:hypothetical protein